jgi:hypothetical protein
MGEYQPKGISQQNLEHTSTPAHGGRATNVSLTQRRCTDDDLPETRRIREGTKLYQVRTFIPKDGIRFCTSQRKEHTKALGQLNEKSRSIQSISFQKRGT